MHLSHWLLSLRTHRGGPGCWALQLPSLVRFSSFLPRRVSGVAVVGQQKRRDLPAWFSSLCGLPLVLPGRVLFAQRSHQQLLGAVGLWSLPGDQNKNLLGTPLVEAGGQEAEGPEFPTRWSLQRHGPPFLPPSSCPVISAEQGTGGLLLGALEFA